MADTIKMKKVVQPDKRTVYSSYKETERQEFKRKRSITYAIIAIVIVICAGVVAGMVSWFLLREPVSPEPTTAPVLQSSRELGNGVTLTVAASGSLILSARIPGKDYVQTLHLGTDIQNQSVTSDPAPGTRYTVRTSSRNYSLAVTVATFANTDEFSCTAVSWTTDLHGSVTDCLDLGPGHWYGGGTLFEQHWPLKLQKPMTPFISRALLALQQQTLETPSEYGFVLEPYWISSEGIALSVRYNAKDRPLHTSWNASGDGKVCVMARYRSSRYISAGRKDLHLDYTVCTGRNVADLHKQILQNIPPWPRPTGVPSATLFERPKWSTRAFYRTSVRESDVRSYVSRIRDHGYEASSIEIDDGYLERYGDFSFHPAKFPNPKRLIDDIRAWNFNVTVWVHPFVNVEAEAFWEGMLGRYYVWTPDSTVPALSSWWRGNLTALVDFTNPNASDWFFDRLRAFQSNYSLESFKFDGGENSWMASFRSFYDNSVNPDYYGRTYAEKSTAQMGSTGLDVRVGLHTQQLPVFVRMQDKDSVVGFDNGLRTLIPTALTYGLLGYPFILPDMIGGNGYRNTSNASSMNTALQYPSAELYLRWLGVTIFMPSVQFSIPPWMYPDDVVDAAKTLLNLRKKYTTELVRLAEESVQTGYPILRPMWWNNGADAMTWTIEDQFMVGDDLLVAPITQLGSSRRDVYVPEGLWQDLTKPNSNRNVTGPKAGVDCEAELHQVPHFRRVRS